MSVAELEKAGDAARATKAYDQAITYFEAAIRKDEKNATLYNKLGLAQLKGNDPASARPSFEKAVKIYKDEEFSRMRQDPTGAGGLGAIKTAGMRF